MRIHIQPQSPQRVAGIHHASPWSDFRALANMNSCGNTLQSAIAIFSPRRYGPPDASRTFSNSFSLASRSACTCAFLLESVFVNRRYNGANSARLSSCLLAKSDPGVPQFVSINRMMASDSVRVTRPSTDLRHGRDPL